MAAKSIASLKVLGGRLCLDFINSANRDGGAADVEYLRRYEDLVAWGRRFEIVTPDLARTLTAQASNSLDIADSALSAALRLRESLYRIFSSHIRDAPAPTIDVMRLNEALAKAGRFCRLAPRAAGLRYLVDDGLADWFLGPVAWSAADLLTSPDFRHVKSCAGPRCGWLFLDTSRNKRRRWCSMDTCGNRAKARQHYVRHRAEQPGV